jgi:hypothetical protein
MRLSALVEFGAEVDPEVTGLTEDSRRVTPGMVFDAASQTSDARAPSVRHATGAKLNPPS